MKPLIRSDVRRSDKKIEQTSEQAAQKVRDKYQGQQMNAEQEKKMEEEAKKAKDAVKEKLTEATKKKESGVDTMKDWVWFLRMLSCQSTDKVGGYWRN